jgi:CheY-like chemotaxis protein
MPANILIVDDNALTQQLCAILLCAQGFRTAGVEDGRAAADIISRKRPDLVLLDIELPGESGLEILRQIKGDPGTRSLPVVAMTAFAMRGDKERFMAAGFDAYLAKPFFLNQLLATIAPFVGAAAVGRPPAGAGARQYAAGLR